MLRIRLQRTGRNKTPFYRVVVAEHSAAVQGGYIDRIGQYNPIAKPKLFQIDRDKLASWIKKGAKPSNTIARLLKGSGVDGMEPYIVPMADRKKKNAGEEAAAAAAPADAPASPASPEATSAA